MDGFDDDDDDDEAFMESADIDDTPDTSGEDDDGIAMEPPLTTSSSQSGGSCGDAGCDPYLVLTPDQIADEMNNMIKEVSSIVHVEPTICRILLHHFKWNKESLLERFYDANDTEKFFREAHTVSPYVRQQSSDAARCSNIGRSPRVVRCGNASLKDICAICLVSSQLTGLECGHQFCAQCWDTYLSTKIVGEGRGQTITCPEHNCDIIVDDAKAMALIRDEKVKRRYQHLITNSFVESNRLLKWCPGTDCGRAIKVQHYEVRPVTCTCGVTSCFACGHEWHEPVNCRLLKLWTKKCSDDSETSNWISANTKECPKCQVTIEKDGGCNHMTCKNTSCKMEFCWMCLGPWEPHGSSWYSCNRFDDSAAKQARDSQERSRAALQRYLHYYNRYMNHQQSLRLESKLYATVKTKMEQMQQLNMSWIEVQFLKKAVDVLSQCRRTLMYTYAFAFYLKKDNQSEIFEDNQRDLEHSTEQLSEFLERDLDSENLVSLKQKVQDKFRYVEQRRTALLKHCSEGTEKNTWTFTH